MDTGTLILVLSFGIPILVILIIFLVLKRGFTKGKAYADALKIKQSNAKPALAKVISASQGLQGGDIKRLIFLNLEINDGMSSPYTASAAWFVDTLHFNKIEESKTINVKVDRENPSVIYPAESWAVYTEGYDSNLSVDKLSGK